MLALSIGWRDLSVEKNKHPVDFIFLYLLYVLKCKLSFLFFLMCLKLLLIQEYHMERRRSSVSSATSEKRSNATIISISAAGESSTDHPDSNNSAPIGRRCICIPINMNFVMIQFPFLVLTPQILYQIINNNFFLFFFLVSPEPIELSTTESLPQQVAAAAPAFADKISIKSATVSESSTGKTIIRQSFYFFLTSFYIYSLSLPK